MAVILAAVVGVGVTTTRVVRGSYACAAVVFCIIDNSPLPNLFSNGTREAVLFNLFVRGETFSYEHL